MRLYKYPNTFTIQSKNILYNKLKKFITNNNIPTNYSIAVYCKKGIRSREAYIILKYLGTSKV